MGDIIEPVCADQFHRQGFDASGKTPGEYYNSPFLIEADWLARRYEWYFAEAGILSAGQMSRMKHVEVDLRVECCLSIKVTSSTRRLLWIVS